MKSAEELVSELYFSDSNTHYFNECRMIRKPYDGKILGVYGQRLDACDAKIRFAAKAYIEIQRIVDELEHGEFIYFDDRNRLDMNFYAESFLIFCRASIDLAVSGYYTYFAGKTNLDSFNDFMKKTGRSQQTQQDIEWMPSDSKDFWQGVYEDYSTEEYYTWIQSLVGTNKGLSLRDLVVHKSNVIIDTYIDDNDKGRFYIGLTSDRMEHTMPWLEHIFNWVQQILRQIKLDIIESEKTIVA